MEAMKRRYPERTSKTRSDWLDFDDYRTFGGKPNVETDPRTPSALPPASGIAALATNARDFRPEGR
ncbi:MAG: hypothetical protein U1F61_09315 [Opitutaceae bacterium]